MSNIPHEEPCTCGSIPKCPSSSWPVQREKGDFTPALPWHSWIEGSSGSHHTEPAPLASTTGGGRGRVRGSPGKNSWVQAEESGVSLVSQHSQGPKGLRRVQQDSPEM